MSLPKQKKNESKQAYLKRCTAERVAAGDDQRKAYAACSQVALGEEPGSMFLLAPVELASVGEGEKKKRTFLMTAKTGEPVFRWGMQYVMDIGGMRTEKRMPVLRQHEPDRIVGSGEGFKDGDMFYVEGEFSNATADAAEVLALADEGYPWQSSIGIWAEEIRFVDTGKKAKVNGREIMGPAEIWTKSYVRECSFVTLGADAATAAIALAENNNSTQSNEEKNEMNITELLEQFPDLHAEVLALGVAQGLETGRVEGHELGVADERKRVQSLLDAGAEDGAVRLAIDNGTAPADAYKVFFEAEKQKRIDALATLADNAPEAQGQNLTNTDGPRPFMDLVNEYQAEKKCSKAEAMKAITAAFPESHKAYLGQK